MLKDDFSRKTLFFGSYISYALKNNTPKVQWLNAAVYISSHFSQMRKVGAVGRFPPVIKGIIIL